MEPNEFNTSPILDRKKLMIAGSLGVLILLTFLIMRFAIPHKQVVEQVVTPNTSTLPTAIPQNITNPSPTVSVELQKAIQAEVKKQQAVDKEYGAWQVQTRNDYPWRVKLPLHSDKYYVYFDLSKKVFIGYLYPKSGENVQQIKAVVIKIMKEQKGIPVDSYPFEWKVSVE
jgi:hypothetical protein